MKAGNLRHRLTIQSVIDKDSSFGGNADKIWTDTITVWGSVSPMMGKEAEQAQMMVAEVSHTIMMRFPDPDTITVGPKNRIIFGDRTFDIEYVLNKDERNCELKLLCFETT